LSLAPGRTLSHYRLVEQIGEGGMGVVWRATDTSLGRDVAIKVLPEAVASDPERMARFEREARLLASLNHPNVAGIYGVGADEGVRFLAMELVDGDELAARIAQGPVPVVEALQLARQIAEALEAAHEKGVVHRDLKPANVKVTPDGTVKVLDFGLAKAVAGETATSGPTSTPTILPTVTSAGTAVGMILGTAAYMSPEQARGKAVDRRADIWAFGCVVFECLTGQRAFTGETVSDTLAKILERDPDLSKLPAATPPRVRELLLRCLAKDPKLRLRDIGDARIVLDEVLAARSPSGRLLVADVPGEGAARRRFSPLMLAIAGVIGLGVGAGLWSLFGPHASRPLSVEGPTCVTLGMPPNVAVGNVWITPDGRTLVVSGRPKSSDGSAKSRVYTRRLDRYDFKELPGTEGVLGARPDSDSRNLIFIAPLSPGAPQKRLARIPLDGSAPATTWVDWKDSWVSAVELENGDMLIQEGQSAFCRLAKGGGAPSAPVTIDAGRPGVSYYTFTGAAVPGDRGAFVDVVSYDARGWHYSVGVMDVGTGKVKVIEEDGGSARYSPTGHLLFSRGDAVLAVPFDPGRMEARGAPVAVWSGLSAEFSVTPGAFTLTNNGALFYRPGQAGGDRELALLDAAGKLESWSPELRALHNSPEFSPDGKRFACAILNARGIDEIWVSDLARPEFRRLGTDPNADCGPPLWSPDGKRIAYFRRGKDGRDGIYVQDADGGEAKRILKSESDDIWEVLTSWLPDGSALLLYRLAPGRGTLALLPLSGVDADASRLRPLLPSAASRGVPMLSPDGRLLAFLSDESGKNQTYVVAFHSDGSTGRPVAVKTAGSVLHRWSADGKTLFVEDERHWLMKVTVTSGPELSVSAPTPVHDFDKLRVKTLLWSVLPDGRFFVGLKNENEDEITRYNLVQNWIEVLKQKMEAAR
jgi:serine/threonine-protein kinase